MNAKSLLLVSICTIMMTIAVSADVLAAGYVDNVLANSPVSYWRLDDDGSTTTALDSSGNGLNAEYIGTFTYGVLGAITSEASNLAVSKTGGAANYIRVESPAFTPGTDAFGVELWAKTSGASSGFLVDWYSGNYGFYFLELVDGRVRWRVRDDNGNHQYSIASSVGVGDGKWHHIVATANPAAGTIKLYIDGRLDASGSMGTLDPLTGSGWFEIGAWSLDPNLAYNGALDEVAFYRTELTATQIQAHYGSYAPLIGPVKPLLMTNKAIGGGDLEVDGTILQQGIDGGGGLNNIGLLVKTTGKVTANDSTSFLLDDGSGVNLKVELLNASLPADQTYVAVTGISSCEKDVNNKVIPVILAVQIGTVN